MNKRKRRTPETAAWDRKIGAYLAFKRRRDSTLSQAQTAKKLGISRGQLSNVESGRTPLSAMIGWMFCRTFDCHPGWVVTGGNSALPNIFPKWAGEEKLSQIEKIIAGSAGAPFRDVWPPIAWLVLDAETSVEKSPLKMDVKARTSKEVIPALPELIERLKLATAQRGQKTALAKWLGVPRQSVTDWLSERQEPGGSITLLMLNWVERWERKNKNARSVAAPRATDSKNESH